MNAGIENDEDAPPLLVASSNASVNAPLGTELQGLSLVKVPITIVTGTTSIC